jgi:hypothetical protein
MTPAQAGIGNAEHPHEQTTRLVISSADYGLLQRAIRTWLTRERIT